MQPSSNILAKAAIAIFLVAAAAVAFLILEARPGNEDTRISAEEESAVRGALQTDALDLSESEEERIRAELAKPPSAPASGGALQGPPALTEEEMERIRAELRK